MNQGGGFGNQGGGFGDNMGFQEDNMVCGKLLIVLSIFMQKFNRGCTCNLLLQKLKKQVCSDRK